MCKYKKVIHFFHWFEFLFFFRCYREVLRLAAPYTLPQLREYNGGVLGGILHDLITSDNPIIHDHRKPLRAKPKAAVVVRLTEVPRTGEVPRRVAEETDAGGEERLFDAHGLGPGVVRVPVVQVYSVVC